MSRRKDKGRLPPFVPIFRHTMKTPAWLALSVGARATFFVLKANYNTNAQNAVFLSARDGAEALGACKDTVCKWLHELEHYGFIVEVQGAHLGVSGTGKAALYRLTDWWFAGRPATYDFQNWGGDLYDPKKQNPVRKIRTPRPKKPDIRVGADITRNGNKRPKNSDIRNAGECTKNSDITSLTTPTGSTTPTSSTTPTGSTTPTSSTTPTGSTTPRKSATPEKLVTPPEPSQPNNDGHCDVVTFSRPPLRRMGSIDL
jgi:hypothetical protein